MGGQTGGLRGQTEEMGQAKGKSSYQDILECGTGPRVHIEGLEDPKEMWDVLEKLYKATSLATRDLAFLQLRASQSDFKSIQEYAEHLKKAHSQLIQLGHKLPDWVLSTSFRLGLKPDLEPYIFSLVEAARANMRELDVDEMMMALIDHDNRQYNLEESNKALMAKFNRKEKKEEDKKSKKGKKEKNTNTSKCEYCDGPGHNKTNCYYLNATNRPDNWKPAPSKENLVKNKKEDRKEDKDKKESNPSSKSAFVPRSMITKSLFTNVHKSQNKDRTWWG